MRLTRDTRGLTLLETIAATLITALLAAAVGSVAHVILSAEREANVTERSTELGLALLREIAALPFDDPQDGETTIGPEAGEWDPPDNRSRFDDVDDYAAWGGGFAVQTKDGTKLNLDGITRAVKIEYVDRAIAIYRRQGNLGEIARNGDRPPDTVRTDDFFRTPARPDHAEIIVLIDEEEQRAILIVADIDRFLAVDIDLRPGQPDDV